MSSSKLSLGARYGSKCGCKIATPDQALCEPLKDQKISVLIPLIFSALSCFCSYSEWNQKRLIWFGCLHLRVLCSLLPNYHGLPRWCFWGCCPCLQEQGEMKQSHAGDMVVARLAVLSLGLGISGSSTSNTSDLWAQLQADFKQDEFLPDFMLSPFLVGDIAEQGVHCRCTLFNSAWVKLCTYWAWRGEMGDGSLRDAGWGFLCLMGWSHLTPPILCTRGSQLSHR